jgi:hypothetical protein
MRSSDLLADSPHVGKQLDPRAVFEGLKDTFGDAALCVENKEWHARIELLRQAGEFTAGHINWYIEGWSQRIHLVNQAGRLATVGLNDGGRYVITTPSHWAHTNRDKSLLTQNSRSNDGKSFIIQGIPSTHSQPPVRITHAQLPVREISATTTITQPELGLLTASRVIGNRVLTKEAGFSLLKHELWALDQELLDYGDAGYVGKKLYQDESMLGLVTAELLSSFTES